MRIEVLMELENLSNNVLCGDFLKTRRTFLSTATLAVGGVIMSASDVKAATSKYDVNLETLPLNWVRSQGGEIFRYAKFIDRLHLKHMSNQQIIAVHARNKGSVYNSLPPKSQWNNIAATLKVADTIANALQEDVEEVVSLYRSPAYNSRCPGAKPNSYHKKNVAMDLIMPSSPHKVYSLAKYYRDNRQGFQGGVGSYRSFTHIDTRGYNATW